MTQGFENHDPDRATCFDIQEDKRVTSIDAFSSILGDDQINIVVVERILHIGGYPDTTTIAFRLTKREAIFLRNRLTAFIEKGLDEFVEDTK